MKNEPSYFDAVLSLVGGQLSGPGDGPVAEFIFTEGQTPPSEEGIQAKLKELEDEYEKQAYARSRAKAYDSIPEQLDQIYHDIDGWKKRIKSVKDKFPKP